MRDLTLPGSKPAEWIEVEDSYLHNQPLIYTGTGRARRRVPDPNVEPTEAWLFCYQAKRTATGVHRSRFLQTFTGKNEADLRKQIQRFVAGKTGAQVVVIAEQERPLQYVRWRGEPVPVEQAKAAPA